MQGVQNSFVYPDNANIRNSKADVKSINIVFVASKSWLNISVRTSIVLISLFSKYQIYATWVRRK